MIIDVHFEEPEFLNICPQTLPVSSGSGNYDIIIVTSKEADE